MAKRKEDGFSRNERECGYWCFLLFVLLIFLVVFDKGFFSNAIEDVLIELSRWLFSEYGLMTLCVILFICCRASDRPYVAVWGFVLSILFVIALYLLKALVFPQELIPIKISKGNVLFQTPAPSFVPNQTTTTGATAFKADFDHAVDQVGDAATSVWNDLQNLFGFILVPVCLLLVFTAVIWAFRIDSGKAFIGTFLVIAICCFLAFRVFFEKRYSKHHSSTTPAPQLNSSQLMSLPLATPPSSPGALSLLDTWTVGAADVRPQVDKLAVPGGGRPRLRALDRLRAVEAKLDDLLIRTGTAPLSAFAGSSLASDMH